jgi:hypothetical protein
MTTLQHDADGFLIGTRLDAREFPNILNTIRRDVAAIRAAVTAPARHG